MVAILMMSAKLATLGLLEIMTFSIENYYIIILAHYVTSKILLRGGPNDIVDVVK